MTVDDMSVLATGVLTGVLTACLCLQLECCGVQAVYGARPGVGAGTDNLELTRQDSWLLFQRTRWYKTARQQRESPAGTRLRGSNVSHPLVQDCAAAT